VDGVARMSFSIQILLRGLVQRWTVKTHRRHVQGILNRTVRFRYYFQKSEIFRNLIFRKF
jgi:hypothetical protein